MSEQARPTAHGAAKRATRQRGSARQEATVATPIMRYALPENPLFFRADPCISDVSRMVRTNQRVARVALERAPRSPGTRTSHQGSTAGRSSRPGPVLDIAEHGRTGALVMAQLQGRRASGPRSARATSPAVAVG
jgi:hypothetical protein